MSDGVRLVASVKVNSNIPALLNEGPWFGVEFVDAVGAETVKIARELVAPGKGPGPHPHRPDSEHEDTGALRDAIDYVVDYSNVGAQARADVYVRDAYRAEPPSKPRRYRDVKTGRFIIKPKGTPPSKYGMYLEVGWTTPSGRTARYPWMYPAATLAAREWEGIAKAQVSRHLRDMEGKLKRLKSSVSATWQLE